MVLGCENSELHRYGLQRFSDQMVRKCGHSFPHAAEKSGAAVSPGLQYFGWALVPDLNLSNLSLVDSSSSAVAAVSQDLEYLGWALVPNLTLFNLRMKC